MSRVTISLLLHLAFSSLIITSIVAGPGTIAYADSGDGGDGDDNRDNGDGGRDGGDRNDDEGFWDQIWGNTTGKSHQQTVRRAVQQKKILPLARIKQIVERKTKSEIISVELERKKRRWVYSFKIVDRRGRLREIYVDATNGSILKSKDDEKD